MKELEDELEAAKRKTAEAVAMAEQRVSLSTLVMPDRSVPICTAPSLLGTVGSTFTGAMHGW